MLGKWAHRLMGLDVYLCDLDISFRYPRQSRLMVRLFHDYEWKEGLYILIELRRGFWGILFLREMKQVPTRLGRLWISC